MVFPFYGKFSHFFGPCGLLQCAVCVRDRSTSEEDRVAVENFITWLLFRFAFICLLFYFVILFYSSLAEKIGAKQRNQLHVKQVRTVCAIAQFAECAMQNNVLYDCTSQSIIYVVFISMMEAKDTKGGGGCGGEGKEDYAGSSESNQLAVRTVPYVVCFLDYSLSLRIFPFNQSSNPTHEARSR